MFPLKIFARKELSWSPATRLMVQKIVRTEKNKEEHQYFSFWKESTGDF